MGQYEEFLALLSDEDKERSIHYALGLLESGRFDVTTLYEEILGPALKNMACHNGKEHWCIWKEHMRTAIVRTIIESCHPYVMREMRKRSWTMDRGKVVLVCPTEEYHEIGIRMVADMFTIAGYDVALIGANTPFPDTVSAVEYFKPKILGISATTDRSLATAERTVKKVREKFPAKEVTIIVGGIAFDSDPNVWKKIGADARLKTFKEISAL